jgi:hypothetical protein
MLINSDLIDAICQKHGPFAWIFEHDGAPSHTSQVTMDWLGETVDVITDCAANSPDLSPIKLLCEILKKLVRRMKWQKLQELKNGLLGHGV